MPFPQDYDAMAGKPYLQKNMPEKQIPERRKKKKKRRWMRPLLAPPPKNYKHHHREAGVIAGQVKHFERPTWSSTPWERVIHWPSSEIALTGMKLRPPEDASPMVSLSNMSTSLSPLRNWDCYPTSHPDFFFFCAVRKMVGD